MSRSPAASPAPNAALRDPRRRLLLQGGLSLAALGSASAALSGCSDASATPADAADAGPGSRFALAVLPDTQFYSRYATEAEQRQYDTKFGSEPFMAQTYWTAAHAATLNIPFLIHLGDVVDQVGKPDQWKVADQAMRVLETAQLPYSVLAGNHDVLDDQDYVDSGSQQTGTDAQRTLASEPYLKWFSPERAARQASFGGRDPSGFHEYHVVSAEGQQFMVLSLSWRISDAGIAWARQVIAAHPTLPVILVNHQLLNIATDGVSPLETPYGQMLWERLIRDKDQIFMTLNGHHHGAAHLTKQNDLGHAVEMMVVDYQMAYQGGNGLMRLYEFDLSHGEISVLSFSPWVVRKPAATLNSFDQAVLTAANESFTIRMDFASRFQGFNPSFKAGAGRRSSLVEAARALVLAGYTEPAAVVQTPPRNQQDYPRVASTAAHWRFIGGVAGQPVAVDQQIADEAGANPIFRAALNSEPGVAQAELGDMLWSADCHHLSAAMGSVQFLHTDKTVGRMSYFKTRVDAALNGQTFADTGYTVEAFVKIDAHWSKDLHAWMNILTRDGRRDAVAGFSGGDGESPPLLFAVSSLREIQWEIVPMHEGTREPQASWSGEVLRDRWIHIALVADPKAASSTLYIEGAPVLRNSGDASGIAAVADNLPWVIGAGSWAGDRADGFFGNLAEIRIAAEPLPATQWLTARAA